MFELSQNFDDQLLSSNFHRFVILCINVEIHQVKRLVFDNNITKSVQCRFQFMLEVFPTIGCIVSIRGSLPMVKRRSQFQQSRRLRMVTATG